MANPGTTDAAPPPSNEAKKEGKPPKPIEYNPRYKGYSFIALTSIVNLSSVSNIHTPNMEYRGSAAVAAAFAALTVCFSIVVLALDRMQILVETFDFAKAMDGYLEGYVLAVLALLWACLTAFITQVDGLGYLTLNIYFSTWLLLASVVYTLDRWSAAKDLLSLAELTGVSATLRGWYGLLFASLVVMGTAINVLALGGAANHGMDQGDAALGAAAGTASTVLALGWIAVHYNFLQFCAQGGWTEVLFCGAAILVWIVTTGVLTKEGGVGSTINGNECRLQVDAVRIQNCSVTYFDGAANETASVPCADLVDTLTGDVKIVFGSNLYVFTWLALASAIHIAFRWKAQQALHFAQAQQRTAVRRAEERRRTEERKSGTSDEEDLDEFEDADEDF